MIVLKFIQNFFLPSAFIFLFFVLGLIFLKKKKKAGKFFLFLGVLCYYLFSITPVSDFLIMPLEEKYRPLSAEGVQEADKAVLLLGGRESNVLRGSEILRIWHLSEGGIKVIVSGTDPLIETSEEAMAVRNFFVFRGIDPKDIIVEGKSRNTKENVANVKKIVGEKPFFLVTSAYHMERALLEFQRLGANPIPAPTDFKRRSAFTYGALDFIPGAQNLRNSGIALHEHLGIIYYRLAFLLGNGNK